MITIKYILFAVIATGLNLLFQYLSLLIYTDFLSLYVAIFMGTLAGLFSKYILDKKYIFYHKPKGKVDDLKKFIRYLIMGGFTTLLFWGTEIGFDEYFTHEQAKYLGAVVGLSLGYLIKYFLDKKYVFKVIN
ncbi:MAG: GtrA family protein [Methylococcales bacterium]|nr:GtrA family protein [Methylococcales bacterium]